MNITYQFVKDYPLSKIDCTFLKRTFDIDVPDLSYYAHECEYFNSFEIPVITDEAVALTHFEDLESAKLSKRRTMEVVVAEGIDKDEVLRFFNYKNLFRRASNLDRYKIIKVMRDYLKNNHKGKQWAQELNGEGIEDVTDRLGAIFDMKHSSIEKIYAIGERDPTLLNSDKTLTAMYNKAAGRQIKKQKAPASSCKINIFKEMLDELNHPGDKVGCGNVPEFKFQYSHSGGIQLTIDDIPADVDWLVEPQLKNGKCFMAVSDKTNKANFCVAIEHPGYGDKTTLEAE